MRRLQRALRHIDLKPSARFIRFVLSGGLAAGAYFCFAYGLLETGLQPLAAGLLAYAFAFGIGYGLQHRWTFSGRHRHGRTLPRYFALQGFCALLSAGILQVASTLAPALAVASLSAVTLGLVSYLASRFWVFADE